MALLEHESSLRLLSFFGVLTTMMVLESLFPKKVLTAKRPLRWASNISIVFVSTFITRLFFSMTAVAFASSQDTQGSGLIRHLSVQYSFSPEAMTLLGIVLLDWVIYTQHVLFHSVPTLWRLHMVHHADRDIDASTGLRFHPLEIVISLGIKFSAIYLIGASALSVLLFEVILNACAMFNHSNVRLPGWLDQALRLVIVTPDVHRVHHSVVVRETNSNYGFNLSIWDRVFGTYRAQPEAGHDKMEIGLEHFRTFEPSRLDWMLLAPFSQKPGGYAINRQKAPKG